MVVTRNLLFLIVAILCFLIALLLSGGWLIHGGNYPAWLAGGLLAFALSHLP